MQSKLPWQVPNNWHESVVLRCCISKYAWVWGRCSAFDYYCYITDALDNFAERSLTTFMKEKQSLIKSRQVVAKEREMVLVVQERARQKKKQTRRLLLQKCLEKWSLRSTWKFWFTYLGFSTQNEFDFWVCFLALLCFYSAFCLWWISLLIYNNYYSDSHLLNLLLMKAVMLKCCPGWNLLGVERIQWPTLGLA